MNSYWNPFECLTHKFRLRQGLQEITTCGKEQVDLACVRGLDHLDRCQTLDRRHSESPQFRKLFGRLLVDHVSAGKVPWSATHLRPTLHSAMPSNSHQATLLAAYHSSGQRQIHYRFYVIYCECVLCDPHAPHEDR